MSCTKLAIEPSSPRRPRVGLGYRPPQVKKPGTYEDLGSSTHRSHTLESRVCGGDWCAGPTGPDTPRRRTSPSRVTCVTKVAASGGDGGGNENVGQIGPTTPGMIKVAAGGGGGNEDCRTDRTEHTRWDQSRSRRGRRRQKLPSHVACVTNVAATHIHFDPAIANIAA
jgi:hypothetical protein